MQLLLCGHHALVPLQLGQVPLPLGVGDGLFPAASAPVLNATEGHADEGDGSDTTCTADDADAGGLGQVAPAHSDAMRLGDDVGNSGIAAADLLAVCVVV